MSDQADVSPRVPEDTHITEGMIAKGAAEIRGLLTMLGVDPDELTEGNDAPTVAAQVAESVLQAGLAGCTVVPDEPEKLEAYDAAALNVVAGALTDLYGFLPLTVRYQAAALALRTVNEWQVAGSVSPKGDNTNG